MFSVSPIVSFDIFVKLYVFGAIALVLLSLIAHLFSSLLNVIDEVKTPADDDFYQQAKKLLAHSSIPDFQSFTIRDNELHEGVRNRLGKSVLKARYFEPVAALQ